MPSVAVTVWSVYDFVSAGLFLSSVNTGVVATFGSPETTASESVASGVDAGVVPDAFAVVKAYICACASVRVKRTL